MTSDEECTCDPFGEITRYYLEGMVPIPLGRKAADAYGMYLLDLMVSQGYEILGGVDVEVVEPFDRMPEFPAGWFMLRVCVNVREFDQVIDG